MGAGVRVGVYANMDVYVNMRMWEKASMWLFVRSRECFGWAFGILDIRAHEDIRVMVSPVQVRVRARWCGHR